MTCPHCGAGLLWPSGPCPSCGRHPESGAATLELEHDRATTGPARAPAPDFAFQPGQPFGDRYTVIEEIGAGGMGQVYKALDLRLSKTVALKLIRPQAAKDAEVLQRFRRELALAQQVTHVNVCRVHDLGESEGIAYISMEYVEGQTLEDLIQSVGSLSPRQTLSFARQICSALGAIHERGIVHRDLKPGNIMVDRAGHVLVMDFGMAYHPRHEKLTADGTVLGTFAYLAPEQARGQATDARSDLYGVGLILFEMLTGQRPPADASPIPLALRDATDCPPPSRLSPEVPPQLDAVVLRCLEREPSRRFQDAADLDRGLAEVPPSLSSTMLPVAPPARRAPWRRIAAVVALLLLAAFVVVRLRVAVFRPPATPISIALLPLSYEGPLENAFLRDVVPLTLAEDLRMSEGIEVAPFGSSRSFDPSEDPKGVARQLGVSYVLHGTLRLQGDRLDTTLSLAGADGEAWSKQWRADVSGVFGSAGTVAAEISRALGGRPPATAVSARTQRARELYLRGVALLEGWDVDRNYDKAEQAFAKALEADDGFALAHAGLALALWKDYEGSHDPKLVERALAEAEKAVAAAPTAPEAQLALGVIQLGRGRSAEAATAFEKAQALAPADDTVCRRIALAYSRLGRNDEAERLYTRAIELRPGYWENYNEKGAFLLKRGQLRPAKEVFSTVIALRPQSPTGYGNKAVAHMFDGELADAEPLLVSALKLHSDPDLHSNLGVVYYGMGRFREAAGEFQAAIAAGLEQLETYGNLGDAYRQIGRLEEARTAYAQAIKLGEARLQVNPNNGVTRAGLAMFLAGSNRCNDARRAAARASADAKENAIVQYYAAVAYAVCGDRANATAATIRAISAGAVADVRTNPDLRLVREDPGVRRLLAGS